MPNDTSASLFQKAGEAGKAGDHATALKLFLDCLRGYYLSEAIALSALNNIGQICEASGHLEKAKKAYEKALLISEDPRVLSNYALCLRDFGEFDHCLKLQLRAAELEPHCPLIHMRLGMTMLLLENFAQGWDEYEARLNWIQSDVPQSTSAVISDTKWSSSVLDSV